MRPKGLKTAPPMSESQTSRIKFAYFHASWRSSDGSRSDLRQTARKIAAEDYVEKMHGKLFCPGCYEPLTRSPRDKPLFRNGRRACFAHLPSEQPVPCDLRSAKSGGKHFLSEEEALQAIANQELVVISSFLNEPEVPFAPAGIYDQTPVEEATGPVSEVPISRHVGETFRLPTRASTVEAICRRFDLNLYRYFVFPGTNAAVRLIDALTDIRLVDSEREHPALYFGRIVTSFNAGQTPKPTNLRMTELACHRGVKDFYVKVVDRMQTQKGISEQSRGRFVLFWGSIGVSGIGLCVEDLAWGEFALLPQMYEQLLPSMEG